MNYIFPAFNVQELHVIKKIVFVLTAPNDKGGIQSKTLSQAQRDADTLYLIIPAKQN